MRTYHPTKQRVGRGEEIKRAKHDAQDWAKYSQGRPHYVSILHEVKVQQSYVEHHRHPSQGVDQ